MIDFKKLIPPTKNVDECYKAGYDCGMNGANTTNCHFAFFSTPEKTKQWEEGKLQGEFDKQNTKANEHTL